jgi:hypothetical protein
MAIDIYLRIPTDPNYDPNQIEVDEDFFNFYQEIEHILTTQKRSVLGDPNFGADLESYVWSEASSSEVSAALNKEIADYCPEYIGKIDYNIDVTFFEGETFDYMLVDITLDGTKVLGIKVR